MSQFVEDRAFDPIHCVGLELESAFWLELVNGVDQTKRPKRHQIILIDIPRKPRSHSTCNELHERRIVKDETLAGAFVTRRLVFGP
jgi:hypothetical protein